MARVLIGLTGIVAVIAAVRIAARLGDGRVLAQVGAVDALEGLLFLLSAAAFAAWLVRALDNIRPLRGFQPRHTRAGALGWWFVPIAWWVMPYRVVREVHESVDPQARAGQWRWLRVAWWMAWIIGTFAQWIPGRIEGQLGDRQAQESFLTLLLIGHLFTALTATLLILLIGRMRSQEARLAHRPT